MAEIGAPKSQQQDGGKLASRIESRASARPPAGAQAIPARNPKAPLPPRVSIPDPSEAGTQPVRKAFDKIEPEALEDGDGEIAHPEISTSSLQPPRPRALEDDDGKTNALPGRFKQALADLQRKPVSMPAPAATTPDSVDVPRSSQDPLALILRSGREMRDRDRDREPLDPHQLREAQRKEPPRPSPQGTRDSAPPSSGGRGGGGGMEKTVPLPTIPYAADTTRTIGEPPSVADLGKAVSSSRNNALTEPFGTPIVVPPGMAVIGSSNTPPNGSPSVAPKSAPSNVPPAPSSGVRGGGVRGGGAGENPSDAPPNSRTLVQGALNLKPSTSPLSPLRTPSPMAIVGGSSLRINSPDRPITPQRASHPPNAGQDVPPPMPMPYTPSTPKSVAPGAGPRSKSGNKGKNPSTAPKSFAPTAGGPPASYERAFRQWSSPAIMEGGADAAASSGPVTFQVYTPQDIGAGRAPMRSLPLIAPKKPSFVLRAGLALVGGIVVFLTAAAVIAVSTEEPKRSTPNATSTASPTPAPEPTPSVISIGDPPIDELPPTPPPPAATVVANPTLPTPPAPAAKPRPRPGSPNAPASLRGMAPPPNPYGNK